MSTLQAGVTYDYLKCKISVACYRFDHQQGKVQGYRIKNKRGKTVGDAKEGWQMPVDRPFASLEECFGDLPDPRVVGRCCAARKIGVKSKASGSRKPSGCNSIAWHLKEHNHGRRYRVLPDSESLRHQLNHHQFVEI